MMLRFDVGDGAGDGWDGNVEFFGHAFEGGRTRVQAVAEPDGDGVGGVVFNQAKSNAFALRYKSPNEKRPAILDRALSSFTAIGVPACSARVGYHTERRAGGVHGGLCPPAKVAGSAPAHLASFIQSQLTS